MFRFLAILYSWVVVVEAVTYLMWSLRLVVIRLSLGCEAGGCQELFLNSHQVEWWVEWRYSLFKVFFFAFLSSLPSSLLPAFSSLLVPLHSACPKN